MPAKGTVRDMMKKLESDGWIFVKQTGSHRQFRHPTKPGCVTVAGRPNEPMPTGTWMNVLRQAGLR